MEHTQETIGADASSAAPRAATPVAFATVVVPIISESLHVDKVEVDRGGVRVTKRVETHEQLVDEELRHEHVDVERRPVGRVLAADEMPEARYEGDTLIVPVIEEVIVTEKRLMLVEEVRIVRTRGTHHDPQRVTLRKEHVEIERLGAEASVLRSS